MYELCEGGKVLTQERCHLDLVWVVYSFPKHSYLLCGSNPYIIDSLMSRVSFHVSNWSPSSVYLPLIYMGLFHSELFYVELNFLHLVGFELTLT